MHLETPNAVRTTLARGHRRSRPAALVAAIVVTLAFASSAAADLGKPRDKEALRLYKEGNAHYKVHELPEAIASYKASIKIEESEAAVYNLALVLRVSKQYEDSIWFYERLLKIATLPKTDQDDVLALIRDMRSELEQEASKKPPQEPVDENATPPPAAIGKVPLAPAPQPSTSTTATTVQYEAAPRWYDDGIAWGLVGAGVASSIVAGGFLMSADSVATEADHEPNEMRREELRRAASSRNTVGAVSGIAGAAFLTAGVIKLVLVAEPARVGRAPSVSVSPNSVELAWRF